MRKRFGWALGVLGAAALALAGAAHPAAAQNAAPKYEIVIDSSQVPELADWAKSLQPIAEQWYPKLVAALPSAGYTAPQKLTISIRDVKGVAYTSGTNIVCASSYFKNHQDDRGAVVHELAHVVQQYHSRGNPGWLVEGVADYLRWFQYEPADKQPHPNPARAKYTDSYRVTAAFLNYLTIHQKPEIVTELNAAMREGRYTPDIWKQLTGKTVDELWTDYIGTLQKQS
jgi:hypothetical protein